MTVRPLKKGWEKRQCQFQVTRPPAHRCAKVAKKGGDFCQHHEKAGYGARSISNINWGGEKKPPAPKKRNLSILLHKEFGDLPIMPVRCPCSSPRCSIYQITAGSFFQGSGFTKAQAELICELINKGRGFDG